MDLKIRPAMPDDAPFMAPLVNEADGGLPLQIWTSLARPGEDPWEVGIRRIQNDDTPVSWSMGWIAELENRPVGLVIVHQLSETPEELRATIMSPLWAPIVELELLAIDTAYIEAVSVIPEMRGQGIGARLLAFAERFRGPEGTSVIMANQDTPALIHLQRNGYREIARRPMVKDGWETPGTHWVLLRKPFAE
ncbi:GNAT family N-acetyltransferase [Rubellimicrobium roseum]|uniref:GNAT family N-acetyltransferase n=1 Tax=Rubellimicrobium roseum TaxID=687525 RepID=A0A5C4NKC4_9RHOB|nr:GNAT family N-acetyltransferase [Rubellimicrobium roseum]TNC74572.1 GNAT family N-acetyltransferase [Rubellimicrobium roseum]